MLRAAKLAASGLLVPVEEVETGTEIIVAPGEAVPLDGEVLSGESAIDESLLTGGFCVSLGRSASRLLFLMGRWRTR